MSTVVNVLLGIGVLAGTLIALELGRRIGVWGFARDAAPYSFGSIDAAVFGLLGLLVAFTFQGAAARFDVRRQLVAQEANAIGTAYLRLDLLEPEARDALKEKFRTYLDSRLTTYRLLPDLEAARAELARSQVIQDEIWRDALAAAKPMSSHVSMLLVQALNQTFDIVTTRTVAAETHPPTTIYVLLVVLLLWSATLAGVSASRGKHSYLHFVGYAVLMGVSVFIICDLEYPRMGAIRVDSIDHVLVDLRERMR